MIQLESLTFDNSYSQLPDHFFQRINPTPLANPFLIGFNPDVAGLLGLDPCKVDPKALAHYFGGAGQLPGAEPLAMKYTGHQFGVYNPDLGDGRGVLLGEVVNSQGERWDLHLKGAGKTAFSRFGDGRAVLRSSIREYLVSEAMHGLGIPTTRALSLVGSEEMVMRDGMMEPCAALLRVSQCHIRFGHFEYFYYSRQHESLKQLADYCVARYFPQYEREEQPYLAMFEEVVNRSANLVAHWQGYGFVHAVLNTDNMSLIGESFDYGPYSFLDRYKPNLISNHNDHQGRYAFSQQPAIIHWNLSCLAQALLPLIEKESLIKVLDQYPEIYTGAELMVFRKRLGLQIQREEDSLLISTLLSLFTQQEVDMNRFFRALASFDGSESSISDLAELLLYPEQLKPWIDQYAERLTYEVASAPIRRAQMLAVNPAYILRNYMAEEAIRDATDGDFSTVHDLLMLLRKPMELRPEFARYTEEPPEWAGGICLTCSS